MAISKIKFYIIQKYFWAHQHFRTKQSMILGEQTANQALVWHWISKNRLMSCATEGKTATTASRHLSNLSGKIRTIQSEIYSANIFLQMKIRLMEDRSDTQVVLWTFAIACFGEDRSRKQFSCCTKLSKTSHKCHFTLRQIQELPHLLNILGNTHTGKRIWDRSAREEESVWQSGMKMTQV